MNDLNLLKRNLVANPPRRVVALTGAGISAESGIPTFRGSDGLWESYRAEDLATSEAFRRDPTLVWRWYEWRRDIIRKAVPNVAHHALAKLESSAGARDVAVVTQNVDGLHRVAGSRALFELHGNIFQARCTHDHIVREIREGVAIPPMCECGAMLRPHIVWFGEPLSPAILEAAGNAVAAADLLLIIGTSALVHPAAGLRHLQRKGLSVEINPEVTPLSSGCDYAIAMKAGEAVPAIVDAILAGWQR
jgi:NAD-dependent deacetylase